MADPYEGDPERLIALYAEQYRKGCGPAAWHMLEREIAAAARVGDERRVAFWQRVAARVEGRAGR